MSGNGVVSHLRRAPKPWAALVHAALLGVSLLLLLGRKPGRFRLDSILRYVPDFYLHVSNASISCLLYLGVGYLWLMLGVPMTRVALVGVVLLAGSIAYELLLPILNTRDILDAWYGAAGVLCGFALLWIIDRWGMVPLPTDNATH
jgi:hypothetical protein